MGRRAGETQPLLGADKQPAEGAKTKTAWLPLRKVIIASLVLFVFVSIFVTHALLVRRRGGDRPLTIEERVDKILSQTPLIGEYCLLSRQVSKC